MPDKKGRFSPMEKAFVKAMSAPMTPANAARLAGYRAPAVSGWKLMENPIIAEATREDARWFLQHKAGSLAVYGLASIALDEKQPAGARVSAYKELGKLSGIAIGEGENGKEPHEMDAGELHSHRAKLEQQRQAIDKALADRATLVIEPDEPETGAFG
jgi:hypothetical protein